MLGLSTLEIAILLIVLAIFFVPAVVVFFSKRVHGGAKAPWIIAAFIFSWLGLLFFFLANPKRK